MIRITVLIAAALSCAVPAQAASTVDPADYTALVNEVVADTGKDPAALTTLLDGAEVKQSILDAIARPAEAKPWSAYRPIFLNTTRIDGGVEYFRQHRALLDATAQRYGVAPEFLVAIIGVETNYGAITGHYRVLDALVTLAFHYPPRADFFRGELKTLLELPANKLAGPIDTLTGSYAGAQGWGQFMPSSIRDFAVDADANGHVDLVNSPADILASVANYLAEHGWRAGEPVAVRSQPAVERRMLDPAGLDPVYPVEQLTAWGYAPTAHVPPGALATVLSLAGADGTEYWLVFNDFRVITRYNKSPLYAMAVFQLAGAIRQAIDATPP